MNYKRIYDSIIDRAKERVPEGYVERHHIVPRCVGGSDERSNLVALTPEEHFLCHVLLVKIYPEHPGLIYAANKMGCASSSNKRPKRKLYGWLKRRYSEQRKIDSMGEGNTQFGTFWINKVGTLENKKIPIGSEIPEGWIKGRRFVEVTKKEIVKSSRTPKVKKEPKQKPQERKSTAVVVRVFDGEREHASVKACALFHNMSSSWVIKQIKRGLYSRISKGSVNGCVYQ